MLYSTKADLINDLKGIVNIQKGGTIKIIDKDTFRNKKIDTLIYNAVFNKEAAIKNISRWLIRSTSNKLGIISSSIQSLYEAIGKKQFQGFTVPAINIRGLTYDVARSIFRAAKKNHVGAFIFEIARSEIGYTDQRPAEYASVILAAAIKEGHEGPVFIQGDHFQINAKKYEKDCDGVDQVGRASCVDSMKFWLMINKEEDKILEAKWQTFGCASAIASTSMLSVMLTENAGMKIEVALKLRPQDIVARLLDLPERKFHCSVLGDKALREALNDYFRKSG